MLKRDAFAIPPAPLALTVAGLMPFVGGAFALLVLAGDPIGSANANLALLVYAAVILSFLGGARWGAEMLDTPLTPPRWSVMTLSVLGALAGWGLALYGVLRALTPELHLAAAGLLLLHGIWDGFAARLPDWYQGLRALATAGAVMSLGAAYLVQALA